MISTATVVAPYVTLRIKDANEQLVTRGFYEGAVLPESADQDDVERLVRKGMVADSGSDDAKFAAPAGTPKPGEPPNVPVTEQPAIATPLSERLGRQQAAAADTGKPKPGPRSAAKSDG